MSTEKKFLGYAESEPNEDLIANPTLPPGQPEAQNNHAAAGVPVAPRLVQPSQQGNVAGMPSLPPTSIGIITGDGRVERSELVMEEDDSETGKDESSDGEGKTTKEDTVIDNMDTMNTDIIKPKEDNFEDSGKADRPLLVSKSGSEEPPVSKALESDEVKMKASSGAAVENKKAEEGLNKEPPIREFTSDLQTDTFKTSKFKATTKIQKFSKRLRVKHLKNVTAELIPHIIDKDNSCCTYVRMSATVERQLLMDMKARKEFGTVRLATQVLHKENICTQHDPVRVRENGEVCFMCKVLDTKKELSDWNEPRFPVSLEIVFQINSTCKLSVQEIESDFMSITEEDLAKN